MGDGTPMEADGRAMEADGRPLQLCMKQQSGRDARAGAGVFRTAIKGC
jgi:hypothetical protein